MAMIRGSFQPISFELKRILKGIHEDLKKNNLLEEVEKGFNQIGVEMGQRHGYSELQNAMEQQQAQQQNGFLQSLYGNSMGAGQLGALGMQQNILSNPAVAYNDPIYLGKSIHQDSLMGHWKVAVKVAEDHGFEYNDNTDSFIHKNGGYVTRKQLEGTEIKHLPRIFIKAKTPNISWLDDRIEEVRVKLC